ncbi:putative amino acid permease YfnA [Smittium culicis]|uniref:Putative amino acid permease YfnA n=1 Tax=Smittium culicis TaxID=133412 RepID=A0A1R1X008_9FUNG|nr:putative amino acid permease YfnA [Smittium culicis]
MKVNSKARSLFKSLLRTKSIEEIREEAAASGMNRTLTRIDLISIGIGCTIGSGIFVLTGMVARDYTGPSIAVSFLIAGIASSLTAFSYAELASMVPASGSAYAYASTTVGEFCSWMVATNLFLEYIVGAGTIAVGWCDYLKSFLHLAFNVKMGSLLTSSPVQYHPETQEMRLDGSSYVNIPAIFIVVSITTIHVVGVKESSIMNNIIVVIKVLAILLFVLFGIQYIDTKNYVPFVPDRKGSAFGSIGIIRGAQKLFLSFIGFDAVASASQESINPKKDLPVGIIVSLLFCTLLYISVSVVMTGISKYTLIQEGSISHIFNKFPKTKWLEVVISLGALAGLSSAILILLMAQPRLFMSMSNDGLLPKIMGKLHPKFKTPYWSTIITGIIVSALSGFLPVNVLADMASCGALVVFTLVNIAVVVLKKTRPNLERGYVVPLGKYFCPVLGALITVSLLLLSELQTLIRMAIYFLLSIVAYFIYPFTRSNLSDGSFFGKPGLIECTEKGFNKSSLAGENCS